MDTDFTLCPSDGPARLIRFTKLEEFLAILAPGNVLLVDRDSYAALTKEEQARVITTRKDLPKQYVAAAA